MYRSKVTSLAKRPHSKLYIRCEGRIEEDTGSTTSDTCMKSLEVVGSSDKFLWTGLFHLELVVRRKDDFFAILRPSHFAILSTKSIK